MTNYQERDLENFIESYLLENNGYIKRVSQNYDKTLCLDTELLISFLQSTQSKDLDELKKRLGEGYRIEILKQIASKITKQDIVKSLQNGIEIRGIKLSLAYRKPSNALNSDSIENYNKNTLSIIRQLYYSEENQNSIDIVVFLNGVPLLSIELKNPLSGQNVYNAIEQYKKDRDPKEKLLQNCIVHFALDCDLAFMATKLEKEKTRFLPFNRGLNNGSGEIGLKSGAGNPLSDGLKSAYLWEKILKKDILLTLIFDFVRVVKDKDQEKVIFPRYHQFDVVEKLLNDAKVNGVGKCYLIQHSAGSGKSNSIAWLAHNLVSLHGDVSLPLNMTEEKLIFDSIIVVTDRKVLDSQIRENVKSFSNTKNLVEAITHGSRQLKEALEEGKKIIITTIQKFPYILDEITTLKSKLLQLSLMKHTLVKVV
ncbi:type I restriction endonuclease [Helicobacter burdigaliensis]